MLDGCAQVGARCANLAKGRVPRWRRRPAQPHPRPAHPIGMRVPQSVRWRWMPSAIAFKARHSAQPPRLSLPCPHAVVLAHDLRERSARQCERSQQEGLELYPGWHSRGGGVCSLAEADFRRCLLQWGAAESPKALDGKHARRSNTQSVRRAPAPPSLFGHDASLVTPSPALQLLRWAPRSCSHHAHH
jgi:hypothetical protein